MKSLHNIEILFVPQIRVTTCIMPEEDTPWRHGVSAAQSVLCRPEKKQKSVDVNVNRINPQSPKMHNVHHNHKYKQVNAAWYSLVRDPIMSNVEQSKATEKRKKEKKNKDRARSEQTGSR